MLQLQQAGPGRRVLLHVAPKGCRDEQAQPSQLLHIAHQVTHIFFDACLDVLVGREECGLLEHAICKVLGGLAVGPRNILGGGAEDVLAKVGEEEAKVGRVGGDGVSCPVLLVILGTRTLFALLQVVEVNLDLLKVEDGVLRDCTLFFLQNTLDT
jgi:hypothetical protein